MVQGPPYGAQPPPPYPPPYGPPGMQPGMQPYGQYPPPPRPQGGGNKTVWIFVAIGVFALFACGIIGTAAVFLTRSAASEQAEETRAPEKEPEKPKPVETPKPDSPLADPVTSHDGRSQIRPMKGWSEIPELHTEATIEWGNKVQEEYLIVISEPRELFDDSLTVDSFANIHITRMRNVIKNIDVSTPRRLLIGGHPALQYEVTGSVDFVKIGYVISYVQGKRSFHQILTWTLFARFNEKKAMLTLVESTFREI